MNREFRAYSSPIETMDDKTYVETSTTSPPFESQVAPIDGWRGADPDKVGRPIAEQFQQTGDSHLLDRLLELYYRPLTRFSERIHFKTGGRDLLYGIDPEDAAHDVIVKILARVEQCQENGKMLPLLQFRYFTHSVRMYYIDYHRKRLNRNTEPTDELPNVSWGINGAPVDIAQLVMRRVDHRHVQDMLATIRALLPETYREVAYGIWQGKTKPEVGAALNLHPSKVARIMRKVRALIGPIVEEGEWIRELIADE